jgi:D-glycero-D-manno-heptose 1,7-bisphosphate phosphatase
MKTVFLDRDGVINEDREDYVKSWEEFSFLPGVLEGIRLLCRHGVKLFIVSNQSAVGRGLITPETLALIHQKMEEAVVAGGGRIEGIYICPHHPKVGCGCRKPKTGLIHQALGDHVLDLNEAYLIGDSLSDIQAAEKAGCIPVLVKTGKGEKTMKSGEVPPNIRVFEDLLDTARWIIRQVPGSGGAKVEGS